MTQPERVTDLVNQRERIVTSVIEIKRRHIIEKDVISFKRVTRLPGIAVGSGLPICHERDGCLCLRLRGFNKSQINDGFEVTKHRANRITLRYGNWFKSRRFGIQGKIIGQTFCKAKKYRSILRDGALVIAKTGANQCAHPISWIRRDTWIKPLV
ncbi:MAG: hypothetical protein EBS54_01025 [Betaproteobacteria bacterium]|nr:hypothetical protein [Betaproteobacteria bacterium]HAB48611.1 hypothetical protein [Lautropia sp.]NBQ79631.1 hypothetical protein [Betaproteobacteria bacterium]NBS40158.1 hypothetical protein [Betaproteobacteria bacterium]NBT05377.1 hypothetical protein [Betaproteobacteria bacterium]